MKERFIEIKNKLTQRAEEFLRSVLEMPPSYEEAYLNFKHGKNCSQTQNLVTFSISKVMTPFDPSALGNYRNEITVKLNYLKCPECDRSVRFSGEVNYKKI